MIRKLFDKNMGATCTPWVLTLACLFIRVIASRLAGETKLRENSATYLHDVFDSFV